MSPFFVTVFLLLFLAVLLTLKLNSRKRTNDSHVSFFLVAVIRTWLAACCYNIELLSGDVELNPRSNLNSSSDFFNFSLESKQYIYSQLC